MIFATVLVHLLKDRLMSGGRFVLLNKAHNLLKSSAKFKLMIKYHVSLICNFSAERDKLTTLDSADTKEFEDRERNLVHSTANHLHFHFNSQCTLFAMQGRTGNVN